MLSDALFIGKAGELLASKYLNITAGLYMLRKAARWIVTCSGLQPIIICHIYIYTYIGTYVYTYWAVGWCICFPTSHLSNMVDGDVTVCCLWRLTKVDIFTQDQLTIIGVWTLREQKYNVVQSWDHFANQKVQLSTLKWRVLYINNLTMWELLPL